MRTPVNKTLYSRIKRMANTKFGKGSRLSKSSWMVHEYVKRGGKYRGKRDSRHGLVAAYNSQRSKRLKHFKRNKRSKQTNRK
jgi:hypothetical protein